MAKLTEDFMQTVQDYLKTNKKGLALIGMMGVGKSEVGKVLSEKMSLPFYEADEMIVQRAGKPIPEIFKQDGEPHFRQLECDVMQDTLKEPCILSAGGGAYIQQNTRAVLDGRAVVVWLYEDPKTVYDRISGDPERPLLTTFEEYDALLSTREPVYAKAAVHVDCAGASVEEVAQKVLLKTAERLKLQL